MAERLAKETGGDLAGFSLYFTTNYTMSARLVALLLACVSFRWLPAVISCGLPAVVLGFGFASLIHIFIFAQRTFNTWSVTPRTRWQLTGRVEVTVDAASTAGPEMPQRETIPSAESIRRYGPTYCWLSGQKEMAPTREVIGLQSARDELRKVAQALDVFQREYGVQALVPQGMPGNEHYRAKLVTLCRRRVLRWSQRRIRRVAGDWI
ncbi:hypothetical protein [Paraburkholderia kururiensis]|uniref:hypothetical protein n=1 Tax=Paraburkholderia kururiensis TaxID=984307 RepID=UPI0018F2D483|nr:hypothetical protein [Paraburkholderia kururiensis]